jgi:hypothetical protein
MQANVPRKFTLVDAMVLIAAIAASLMQVRHIFPNKSFVPDEYSWYEVWQFGLVLNEMLSVVALCLSLALFILRLANPRPRARRLFRQPGMAACMVVVVYSILLVASFCVYRLDQLTIRNAPLYAGDVIGLLTSSTLGGAVAGAWIALWSSRAVRLEPSWIDRSGRALGAFWILGALLSLPDVFG